MNPVLEALKKRKAEKKPASSEASFNSLLNDIRAGRKDAKQEAFKVVGEMSPGMKMKLRMAFPMIAKVALSQGGDEGEIKRGLEELKNYLNS